MTIIMAVIGFMALDTSLRDGSHFLGMARSPFLPITKTLANGMIEIELDTIKT